VDGVFASEYSYVFHRCSKGVKIKLAGETEKKRVEERRGEDRRRHEVK
jgi:hypothetical protein